MSQPDVNFVRGLRETGMLSDSECTMIGEKRELTDEESNIDQKKVLDELLGNGRLTPFQAEEIEAGRGHLLRFGNYLLLSRLGEGTMGTVYKALHLRMQRVVALKTLKPETSKPAFIERFYREVRAAARLNHPHAVAAYDADECESGHYLVMEYVDGKDLSAIVKRDGPMSVSEAVSAIRQAAEALAYAHRFGIIHRDIKPANLMRDAHGNVKVADLGLARLSNDHTIAETDERAELTQSGSIMGTIDYMAPEQAIDAARVDARADIYSLGCTLYFLLTGRAVYEHDSLMARLVAHRDASIPSLRDRVPDVPEELDQLFCQMLAKTPEDRCACMEDVAAALKAFSATDPVAESLNLRAQTVFVIEPSRFQSRILQSFLQDIGVDDIHLFRSVHETIAEISAMRPDLVVTSLQLPDGTGIEFLQRLRDDLRWSLMPVLLLTSIPLPPEQLQFIRNTRAVALLEKPFSQEQFTQAVQGTISESRNQSPSVAGLDQLRVLIVDDSSVARRRIEATLAELGFARFSQAENGKIAADILQQRTFELIVTDYNMPEMNGYELVAWTRRESPLPHVPIIMCTTEYDPEKLGEVYQLGVSAICNKSFEQDLVRNIVIRLFK